MKTSEIAPRGAGPKTKSDISRKGGKAAKFGQVRKYFFFASCVWREQFPPLRPRP